MNQERKKIIAAMLKTELTGSGIKYSLGVDNHSSIVMNIRSAPWNMLVDCDIHKHSDHIQVNIYHIDSKFLGLTRDWLNKINKIMNFGNYDNSDLMSDYFYVGWYVSINIGTWSKPFFVKG